MWKKLTLVLFLLLIGIGALGYSQLSKWENNVKQQLVKQQIAFSQLEVRFFPQPALVLQQFHYQSPQKERAIFAEFFQLNVNPWALLIGNLRLDSLLAQNATLWLSADSEPTLKQVNVNLQGDKFDLSLTDLKGFTWQRLWQQQLEFELDLQGQDQQQNQFNLAGKFSFVSAQDISFRQLKLGLTLAEPSKTNFFQQRQFNIELNKGHFAWQDQHYVLALNSAIINQQPWALEQLDLYLPSQNNKRYIAQLSFVQQGQLQILLSPNQPYVQAEINAQKLPLLALLKPFALPELVDGLADFSALIRFQQFAPVEGKAQFNVQQGAVKGLNILDLISQYVPINYDRSQLQNQGIDTQFEQLSAAFHWDTDQLNVPQVTLTHPYFIAQGEGSTDLRNAECDYHLNISPNKEDYKMLSLPVHFFGNCYAPQYKVSFKQDLRHQLKQLLKEKFR